MIKAMTILVLLLIFGNVEFSCEQLENEADSDREGQMITSKSYSKLIKQLY